MPQCKGCNEVVSAFEFKDGYCSKCSPDAPVEIKEKAKDEKTPYALYFFIFVAIVMGFFAFSSTHTTPKDTPFFEEGNIYTTKANTVGCEDMNKLYVAIKEYRNGGLTALMPLVESAGCLWLPNRKVKLLKKIDFAYEVYFDNPEGKSRYLWIDEREIK